MNTGKTLFAQIMDFLPWSTFHRIVQRYGGDYRVRYLRCAEQFRIMAFAQLTYRESLRDIEACLSAQAAKLYHMGFRGPVTRSTLPTPTNPAICAFTQTSLNDLSLKQQNSMPERVSVSIYPIPPMLWTLRLSISACRCFLGLPFGPPRLP